MTGSPVEQLTRSLEGMGRLVEGVRDEQWDHPTPCTEWTVRDLVHHVVAGNQLFADVANSDPVSAPDRATTAATNSSAAGPGSDYAASAYRDSAAALLSAFSAPGALEVVVTVPFGAVPGVVAVHLRIVEALVHGWDLARATGQASDADQAIAQGALGFTRSALADIPPERRGGFAASQPAADELPALDRLAAMLGRDVSR